MSRKVKVLVSVLLVVVLLTVGGAATVMAQEDGSAPTPEPTAKIFMETANTTGLLARVAVILGVTDEELASAFREARQEMCEAAFISYIDKALEEERITEGEYNAIIAWWEARPEAVDSLFPHALGALAIRGRHMNAAPDDALGRGAIIQEQARTREQWKNRLEALDCPLPRARIFKAVRGQQQIAVPRGWGEARVPRLAD